MNTALKDELWGLGTAGGAALEQRSCMECRTCAETAPLCSPMDCGPPGSCVHGLYLWGLKTPGKLHHREPHTKLRFASRSSARFPQWVSKKNPLSHGMGRGEGPAWTERESALLNEACLQGERVTQSPTCWDSIGPWLTWGEGNAQPNPTTAILSI